VFDHLSVFQTGKLWLTTHTGLSKDALHVYIGLLILLVAAQPLRRRVGDWIPLIVVAVAALAGELWDMRDVYVLHGKFDLAANWHDVWNTILWPAVITLAARHTALFRRRG
jgi:hypothetical protein